MSRIKFDGKSMQSKNILCDIEGTTTSISFVKDTLFPYALKHCQSYLSENWESDEVKAVVGELRKLANEDFNAKIKGAIEIESDAGDKDAQIKSIVKNVEWQMSLDRKTGPLKTLQGLIWLQGYKDKTIQGHVYDDVPKAFEEWTKAGHKIYIYSSGSVDAQKLLFANSVAGDLLQYVSGHFDTKIGAKQEPESYINIIKEMETTADEIVFLTDIVKEAKAAKDSGMHTIVLERPGNASYTVEEKNALVFVKSFADIPFETIVAGVKRKNDETVVTEQNPSKLAKLADEPAIPETIEAAISPIPAPEVEEKMEVDEASTVVDDKVIVEKPAEVLAAAAEKEKEKAETEPTKEAEPMEKTEDAKVPPPEVKKVDVVEPIKTDEDKKIKADANTDNKKMETDVVDKVVVVEEVVVEKKKEVEEPAPAVAVKPDLAVAEKPNVSVVEKPDLSVVEKPELAVAVKPDLSVAVKADLSVVEKPAVAVVEVPKTEEKTEAVPKIEEPAVAVEEKKVVVEEKISVDETATSKSVEETKVVEEKPVETPAEAEKQNGDEKPTEKETNGKVEEVNGSNDKTTIDEKKQNGDMPAEETPAKENGTGAETLESNGAAEKLETNGAEKSTNGDTPVVEPLVSVDKDNDNESDKTDATPEIATVVTSTVEEAAATTTTTLTAEEIKVKKQEIKETAEVAAPPAVEAEA